MLKKKIDIIDKWLDKHGDPKIKAAVEKKLKEIEEQKTINK
jgi:putative component of toxin-antitoxin plasmid stabilization module